MQAPPDIHSYPDTARRGQLSSVRLPLSIALLSAGFAGMSLLPAAAQVLPAAAQVLPAAAQVLPAAAQVLPAAAQVLPAAAQVLPSAQGAASTQQTAASSPDAIKQREQELEAARAQQKSAAELQMKLQTDLAAIGQDHSKLNQRLIDIAGQVRSVEARIGDAETRLRPLDSREQQIRSSLGSRRSEIVEVLATLQRAGRRMPPALLVRPEDALQSLRTAMLLGSVVPELRGRADRLATDLGELVSVRKNIATERDQLAVDRDKLRDDQTRLAALVDERQRKQSSIEKDMAAESARAITLSQQVDGLEGLIAKMEQDLKSAARAAASASLRGAPVA